MCKHSKGPERGRSMFTGENVDNGRGTAAPKTIRGLGEQMALWANSRGRPKGYFKLC